MFNAYSSLGIPDWHTYPWGKLIERPELATIGARHGLTPAQVLLAWQYGQGILMNPRSMSLVHMRENLDPKVRDAHVAKRTSRSARREAHLAERTSWSAPRACTAMPAQFERRCAMCPCLRSSTLTFACVVGSQVFQTTLDADAITSLESFEVDVCTSTNKFYECCGDPSVQPVLSVC